MNHAFVCQIKGLQSITLHGSLVQQRYRIKQEAAIHLLFVLNTTKKKERKKENDWDRAPFLSMFVQDWVDHAGIFGGQGNILSVGILNPDTEQKSSEIENTERETQSPPHVHTPKVTRSLGDTHVCVLIQGFCCVLLSGSSFVTRSGHSHAQHIHDSFLCLCDFLLCFICRNVSCC